MTYLVFIGFLTFLVVLNVGYYNSEGEVNKIFYQEVSRTANEVL